MDAVQNSNIQIKSIFNDFEISSKSLANDHNPTAAKSEQIKRRIKGETKLLNISAVELSDQVPTI